MKNKTVPFSLQQFIQQLVIPQFFPIGCQTQREKQTLRGELRSPLLLPVIPQAAAAQAEILIPVGNAASSPVQIAADSPFPNQKIGQAEIPVGENRLFLRSVLLQPEKQSFR